MWIEDPLEIRLLDSRGWSSLPLVGSERVKSNSRTLNEIAAYQLGGSLGIPLPCARYFFTKRPLQIDGIPRHIGAPVLLIEDISPTRSCPNIIDAPCCSNEKAKCLAFFTLCGGCEWPEVHITESGVYLLDLEFQFALFPTVEIDVNAVLCDYKKQSESAIRYSLETAQNGGLEDAYWEYMNGMVASCGNFSPDFGQTSSMKKVSRFIKNSIELRLEVISRLL